MPEKIRRAIYRPSAQQVRAPVDRRRDFLQGYMFWLVPLKAAIDNEKYFLLEARNALARAVFSVLHRWRYRTALSEIGTPGSSVTGYRQ